MELDLNFICFIYFQLFMIEMYLDIVVLVSSQGELGSSMFYEIKQGILIVMTVWCAILILLVGYYLKLFLF